jgi:hypothetical protein
MANCRLHVRVILVNVDAKQKGSTLLGARHAITTPDLAGIDMKHQGQYFV